jgi:lipopolysaccharide export system permease protein
MKTLHWYLTRQVLLTLVMTVLVFTFVLLLVNVLKEILTLLVNRQATPDMVLQAVGLLIPYVLVYALPMGMLTATLLVFGRFSADQELTAARANGISLLSLISPILMISLLLSVFCAWLNLEAGPHCRQTYRQLLHRLGVQKVASLLVEGRFITVGNYVIHVGKIEGDDLREIIVSKLDKDGRRELVLDAPRGLRIVDTNNQTISLQLFDSSGAYRTIRDQQEQWRPTSADAYEFMIDMKSLANRTDEKPDLSDMTFRQLLSEIKELERISQDTAPLPLPDPAAVKKSRPTEVFRLLLGKAQVHLNLQVAFSFACFGFTLIGIPLAVRTHRRETSISFALSIILVSIYYAFIVLGKMLDAHPEFCPHLIVWIPNLLFQAIGAVLLWRANRGI